MNAAYDNPHGYSIADLFEYTVDRFPERPALHYVGCERFPERTLSFRELDGLANQVARWAREVEGLQKGDCVALYMENRLEYIVAWYGLCKAGIKTAFINNTIRLQSLVHSIKISNARLVLFGVEVADGIEQVFRTLIREHGIEAVAWGGPVGFARSMDAPLSQRSSERLDREEARGGVKFGDVFGYVYTSGTTGLPKAVNVTHAKQWAFASGYSKYMTENDIVYSSGMPLYHSSAGAIGTGMVFHYGACQVIRKRFSASAWLDDVRRTGATMVQYIGELCRYVLSQPPTPQDGDNRLKLAAGNGLSREIWADFQMRFKIDAIREFYGATEGNGAFKNDVLLADLERGDHRAVGAVGKLGSNPLMARFVRYDVDTDELVRDANGRLVDCEVGEPGELLFPQRKDIPSSQFVGYSDPEASKKKLVQDGDVSFVRSGDLLVVTKDDYVQFVDRVGDTFRSKGENVSTTEVAQALNLCPVVLEANVYGVQVPHTEGRFGMAAIVLREAFAEKVPEALDQLAEHAARSLPSYARPIFIRVQLTTATTQTFKHQKVALRKQAFDPAAVSATGDQLFWLSGSRYVPFTQADYDALAGQRVKL
ncbi:Very long-chain acyl-CoA synthetase [Hondaea fermentalgiana]|uniref:Very long-chain acyl-CoA synthetase n=1 Tax=Hondaea fermentalgiana TaxID=2315210 RepID=A0A2R5GRQ8_9STRA|nr:Very long-chain acyl-CoA synthetase [Hondaea fermentalgiana]|eukprot:GBG33567.1 Very long-chain acyl-CoA synthetase [Hondaea fermentalgiana]